MSKKPEDQSSKGQASRSPDKATSTQSVGYGKPPAAYQFKKGTSGNPKGRPRGRKSYNTEIDEVLNAPVTVIENGKRRKVTSRKAVLLRVREKSLAGDLRATETFLQLAAQKEALDAAVTHERRLSGYEDEILARFIADQAQTGTTGDDRAKGRVSGGGRHVEPAGPTPAAGKKEMTGKSTPRRHRSPGVADNDTQQRATEHPAVNQDRRTSHE